MHRGPLDGFGPCTGLTELGRADLVVRDVDAGTPPPASRSVRPGSGAGMADDRGDDGRAGTPGCPEPSSRLADVVLQRRCEVRPAVDTERLLRTPSHGQGLGSIGAALLLPHIGFGLGEHGPYP